MYLVRSFRTYCLVRFAQVPVFQYSLFMNLLSSMVDMYMLFSSACVSVVQYCLHSLYMLSCMVDMYMLFSSVCVSVVQYFLQSKIFLYKPCLVVWSVYKAQDKISTKKYMLSLLLFCTLFCSMVYIMYLLQYTYSVLCLVVLPT